MIEVAAGLVPTSEGDRKGRSYWYFLFVTRS